MGEDDDYAEPGRQPRMPHFWMLFFVTLILALAIGWLVWVIFLTPSVKENT